MKKVAMRKKEPVGQPPVKGVKEMVSEESDGVDDESDGLDEESDEVDEESDELDEDDDNETSHTEESDDADEREDDEFEDQGSSSDEDSGEEEEEEGDAELSELENKTRRFTVDREKEMQRMREDGSLSVASKLHVDDLSSDDEETVNTIGNVPLRWYEEYDHIGYTLEGKKILKSRIGDGIDNAIAAKDDPNYEYVLMFGITGFFAFLLTGD